MITFEEAQEILTEIADSLPEQIFEKLNGGILLLPDTIIDGDGLITLGMYHIEPAGFGRYITIHYGSMVKAYGHISPEAFAEKLDGVLRHELVHHLESLAGDRSLEIKDAIDREKYLRGIRFRKKKADDK